MHTIEKIIKLHILCLFQFRHIIKQIIFKANEVMTKIGKWKTILKFLFDASSKPIHITATRDDKIVAKLSLTSVWTCVGILLV